MVQSPYLARLYETSALNNRYRNIVLPDLLAQGITDIQYSILNSLQDFR